MFLFSYYNHNGRLIRVHESDLKHFRDITPLSEHPISEKELKQSYLAWREEDYDTQDWIFIDTYHFCLENDDFMKMYKSFDGVASYRKPKQKRTTITPELIELIQRKYNQGETCYSIANQFGISQPTVKKYLQV